MNRSPDAPAFSQELNFDITDVREYEHMLKSEWHARSFEVADGGKDFRAFGKKLQLPRLSISRSEYEARIEIAFEGLAFVRQQFAIGAAVTSTRVGRNECNVDLTTSCVVPMNVETTVRCPVNHQQVVVRIPPSSLETSLTSLIGVLPRSALRFNGGSVSGPHYERLRRFLMLLIDEISRPDTPLLVAAELEDTFLMQFLAANDHNHRDRLLLTPKQATPKSVQMIEEYIIANWDKPFTIDEVAAVTGVAARTIYATFKQHRGYGPKTFLRQTRLNKARELLRKGAFDVATVAKLCGFSNAGHFAHYYRTAFGELPSSTSR